MELLYQTIPLTVAILHQDAMAALVKEIIVIPDDVWVIEIALKNERLFYRVGIVILIDVDLESKNTLNNKILDMLASYIVSHPFDELNSCLSSCSEMRDLGIDLVIPRSALLLFE